MSRETRRSAEDIGAALIERSEQMVMVFTREERSIEHLRVWAKKSRSKEVGESAAEWADNGKGMLAIAVPRVEGEERLAQAKDVKHLVSVVMPGLGTEESGLSKSLCRVMSGDSQTMDIVGDGWKALGGMSLAGELAKMVSS